jgi:hypothetical protein
LKKENADLRKKNSQMSNENAELRNENADLRERNQQLENEEIDNAELRTNNAELREIVKQMEMGVTHVRDAMDNASRKLISVEAEAMTPHEAVTPAEAMTPNESMVPVEVVPPAEAMTMPTAFVLPPQPMMRAVISTAEVVVEADLLDVHRHGKRLRPLPPPSRASESGDVTVGRKSKRNKRTPEKPVTDEHITKVHEVMQNTEPTPDDRGIKLETFTLRILGRFMTVANIRKGGEYLKEKWIEILVKHNYEAELINILEEHQNPTN